MNLTHIRRTIRAALTTPKPLRYTTLNGTIGTDLAQGRLITIRQIFDRLGAPDTRDGYQSWAGRHIKKAHTTATGRPPQTVWVQHRTTGKWIHVACYTPTDPALIAGVRAYKRTAHLADRDAFTVCA